MHKRMDLMMLVPGRALLQTFLKTHQLALSLFGSAQHRKLAFCLFLLLGEFDQLRCFNKIKNILKIKNN
jgi:hypothetical protein